jgi:hypothetical protein
VENAEQKKYGTVLKGLKEQSSLDQDHYPKTINHVMNVLSNRKFDEKYYEGHKKNHERKSKDDKKPKDGQDALPELPKEINFAQIEGSCNCCGQKGHRRPKCPEKDKDKKVWAINKTKEATFIQNAVSGNVDTQSVVSALQAINQEQHPFGWMACSIVMGQIEDTMKEWVLINTASKVNVFATKSSLETSRRLLRGKRMRDVGAS